MITIHLFWQLKNHYLEKNHFKFTELSSSDVLRLLLKIDTSKAVGFDNIPGKLLKIGASSLAVPVTALVNMSIQENTFPDLLKYAEVSSLYKKGDPLLKNNYRPLSVLSALSKIFEKLINFQLSSYFDSRFSDYLSGFRQKYSCQTTLLRMITNWKNSLDNGKLIGSVGIDLSKAFDSLPHGLIIAKLAAYGLDRSACLLLCSYLYNRHQRVRIGSVRSEWLNLNRGVPQGSVLGPVLFNIYINDMFMFNTKCDIYNYADDNCISFSSDDVHNIENVLKEELNVFMKWFEKNSLSANATKFQSMLVYSRKKPLKDIDINFENVSITSSDCIKMLGIHVDERLNFDQHVTYICRKAGRQINVLKRMKNVLDFESRLCIYRSFILSNFSYCPVVWMFTNKRNIDMIDKIQERALRFVCNDYVSDYKVLLEKCNLSTIKLSMLRNLAIEVFKCVNDNDSYPEYLKSIFVKKVVSYNLRNERILTMPKVKTTTHGIKSFHYFGAKIWNMLPANCKSALNIEDFKTMINYWSGPSCKCTMCCRYV